MAPTEIERKTAKPTSPWKWPRCLGRRQRRRPPRARASSSFGGEPGPQTGGRRRQQVTADQCPAAKSCSGETIDARRMRLLRPNHARRGASQGLAERSSRQNRPGPRPKRLSSWRRQISMPQWPGRKLQHSSRSSGESMSSQRLLPSPAWRSRSAKQNSPRPRSRSRHFTTQHTSGKRNRTEWPARSMKKTRAPTMLFANPTNLPRSVP
mmetsp:Transcript_25002/g.73076  ORF Transcript_25002/g.73076 Transcript_25002/m.73076 type:complete len:209 (+) Transcript_25002:561-1187(+)